LRVVRSITGLAPHVRIRIPKTGLDDVLRDWIEATEPTGEVAETEDCVPSDIEVLMRRQAKADRKSPFEFFGV